VSPERAPLQAASWDFKTSMELSITAAK